MTRPVEMEQKLREGVKFGESVPLSHNEGRVEAAIEILPVWPRALVDYYWSASSVCVARGATRVVYARARARVCVCVLGTRVSYAKRFSRSRCRLGGRLV